MPGNGKTYATNQHLRQVGATGCTRQVLLSGEVSEPLIERKFKELMQFDKKRRLKALYVKVEYMTNLEQSRDFLNNFLFKLCLHRYVCVEGEHHFFDEHLHIVFEIASYHMDFLRSQLWFLASIKQVECVFNIERFDFSDQLLSEDQIVGVGLKHILEEHSYHYLDYASSICDSADSMEDLCDKFHTIYQLNR